MENSTNIKLPTMKKSKIKYLQEQLKNSKKIIDACIKHLLEAGVIQEINQEQALSIIDTRKPLGLFIQKDGGKYIGIDNQDREAWTEEFDDRDTCIYWLLDASVIAEKEK